MIEMCIGLRKTMNFGSRYLPLKDKKGNRLEQMRGEKMTNKLFCCSAVLMLHGKNNSCGISLLICLVVDLYCGSA